MKNRILVVDDDADIVEMLKLFLSEKGYEVDDAASAKALRDRFAGPQPDAVLLDWILPDGDGIELLEVVRTRWPETEVIMLTGHGNINAAIKAVKRGAFDFVTKPFEPDCLLLLLERACEQKRSRAPADPAQPRTASLNGRDAETFGSAAMQNVLGLVKRIASSDTPVFITGESGTGKKTIAELVHALSRRAQGPLVKLNCATVPRELIELELFGAVRGARPAFEGHFQKAQGGSLLLEQITEMPPDTQFALLRVLQDKEFHPVGATTASRADCRVIAATDRRAEDALREGRLRDDLFSRLSSVIIRLPPLRERREDILPLARAFLKRFAAESGSVISGFTPAAADALQRRDWPGNVRQLETVIQRAVLVCEGGLVDLADLPLNG